MLIGCACANVLGNLDGDRYELMVNAARVLSFCQRGVCAAHIHPPAAPPLKGQASTSNISPPAMNVDPSSRCRPYPSFSTSIPSSAASTTDTSLAAAT